MCATMLYGVKGVASMVSMIGDDGDDILPVKRDRARDRGSLKNIHRARGVQNENLEEHEREPDGGKITHTEMHHHSVTRADAAFDWYALSLTKKALPKMEYLCFIGMEFGMVEDDRGILRWHPGKREMVERDLSFQEVGRHYGLSDATVQEYDRRARRRYGDEIANIRYQRRQLGHAVEE